MRVLETTLKFEMSTTGGEKIVSGSNSSSCTPTKPPPWIEKAVPPLLGSTSELSEVTSGIDPNVSVLALVSPAIVSTVIGTVLPLGDGAGLPPKKNCSDVPAGLIKKS